MIFPTLMPGIGKYARDYVIATGIPWTDWEYSVFIGASPSVANGDISAVTVTDPGGYTVGLTPTGVVVIDAGAVTLRQSFYCDVYDVSLRKWYGDTIEWVNNALPVYDHSIGTIEVREGQSIAAVNLGAAVTDTEHDVLTYAVVSGSLPPGLHLDPTTGIITGTS